MKAKKNTMPQLALTLFLNHNRYQEEELLEEELKEFDESRCLQEITELEEMERQDVLPLEDFLSEAPEFAHEYFLAKLKNN